MASFMTLPTELRLQIIEDVLATSSLDRFQTFDKLNDWHALLLVSKTLHAEVTSLLHLATLTTRISSNIGLLAGAYTDAQIQVKTMPIVPSVNSTLQYFSRFASVKLILGTGLKERMRLHTLQKRAIDVAARELGSKIKPFAAARGRTSHKVFITLEDDLTRYHDPMFGQVVPINEEPIDPSAHYAEYMSILPMNYLVGAAGLYNRDKQRPDAMGRLLDALLGYEQQRRRLARQGVLRMKTFGGSGEWLCASA